MCLKEFRSTTSSLYIFHNPNDPMMALTSMYTFILLEHAIHVLVKRIKSIEHFVF